VLTSDIVTISRAYGHEPKIEATLDYKRALEFLYSKFKLDAAERSVLNAAQTTSALIEALPKLTSPTAKHQEMQAHLGQVRSATTQVGALIRARMPKFMYFAAYDRMDGAIQVEQAKTLIANGQINLDQYRGTRLFTEFLKVDHYQPLMD
jgi:hypothetical protein